MQNGRNHPRFRMTCVERDTTQILLIDGRILFPPTEMKSMRWCSSNGQDARCPSALPRCRLAEDGSPHHTAGTRDACPYRQFGGALGERALPWGDSAARRGRLAPPCGFSRWLPHEEHRAVLGEDHDLAAAGDERAGAVGAAAEGASVHLQLAAGEARAGRHLDAPAPGDRDLR